MSDYIDRILDAETTDGVCVALQAAIDSLKANNYFANVPGFYHEISAESPDNVQDWFDEMKGDEQAKEEGNLKEIYGLYEAALRRLRQLGFHREPDT